MRFAVDTGGTFTDLVIEDDAGAIDVHKAPTTPDDPVIGILDAFEVAALARQTSRADLLREGRVLIHGTTRGLNAVLTGATARTALLTTAGHPDVLVLREGGRTEIFDLRRPYPAPYIPRSLTFEIPERIGPTGEVVLPLDERAVESVAQSLLDDGVEAVAVCLLWSIVNPAHEIRVGEVLTRLLPGVPFTLSHQLNPCLREYRRASATAIDASLKPTMTEYIQSLRTRLAAEGFGGRTLIVTSAGAALDAEDVAAAPIHSLNSGPSMAPVAGRYFATMDARSSVAVVADTGGTSYDVSVVRNGRIPWTRETWIGEPYFGHMTGFPSVDVRSVGAGGGSIAHVDSGGLLHVGPESAGAEPGPAAYGRGGSRPTLTDACLVLGILDPEFFLGGRRKLDLAAARSAIEDDIAGPLCVSVQDAAAAVLRVATERMVGAIEQITIRQGIDPRGAVLVGGGGAAGFNAVAVARQLGCPEVIIPPVGSVLSAAGALISDLSRSFEAPHYAIDVEFDFTAVNGVLAGLERRAREFIDGPGRDALTSTIEFSVEARYPHQVWELEVPLRSNRVGSDRALAELCEDFHAVHSDVFGVSDDSSPVEFQSWHARARCPLATPARGTTAVVSRAPTTRHIALPDHGPVTAMVWRLEAVPISERIDGPAIVETPTSTVVVDPGAAFVRLSGGTLHIEPAASARRSGQIVGSRLARGR
jgi:N-methylhydantoinase A